MCTKTLCGRHLEGGTEHLRAEVTETITRKAEKLDTRHRMKEKKCDLRKLVYHASVKHVVVAGAAPCPCVA